MPVRFTLVVIFAVLAAASRPVATGGEHDLLAVGVKFEDHVGEKSVVRTVLTVPDEAALRAYEAILRSPAGAEFRKKTVIEFTRPVQPTLQVHELVFYGVRSRAGRAKVVFRKDPADLAPGAAEALECAREIAALPDSVTASAARIVLRGTNDDGAYAEALDALAKADAIGASAEARATALDGSLPGSRRAIAVRVLRSLGGAASHPDEFRRLAADADPAVSEAAK